MTALFSALALQNVSCLVSLKNYHESMNVVLITTIINRNVVCIWQEGSTYGQV